VSIMRELENLLREIAEAQQPAAQRPAPPRPPQAQPAPPKPAQPKPTPPKPAQRPSSQWPGAARGSAEVLDAEVVDAAPARRHAAAAKQVERRLDTSDVTAGAMRLGAEVGLADEKVEAHLREKFDHQLSRIDDPDDEVGAAAGAAFATRIAEMFRNPQSIQQAFILNEILNPPESRW
jgi:hypothetical protein